MIAEVGALALGAGAGSAATAWVHRWVPFRSPSNHRRLANRETDVALRKLEVEEAQAIREVDQVRINHENDLLKGQLALEQSRVAHQTSMRELETAEAKATRPELAAGEAIRSRRQELHWTQKVLARHLADAGYQIPVARISAIENGDLARIDDVRALTRELDLSFVCQVARPDRSAKPPSYERDRLAREARMAKAAAAFEPARSIDPDLERGPGG